MINKLLVVVVAAAGAGAIIGLIPESAPAVAARTSHVVQSIGTSISIRNKSPAAARTSEIRKVVCTQTWPYYERSCLQDGPRLGGKSRVVRIVTADRSVIDHIPQPQR